MEVGDTTDAHSSTSCSESQSESSSSDDDLGLQQSRKRTRHARKQSYMTGMSRKAYRVNDKVETSVHESPQPNMEGVCRVFVKFIRSCEGLS